MTTRIAAQRSFQRVKTAERHQAQDYLSNLLFEGEIKKACDEALGLLQEGKITETDFRLIQSQSDMPSLPLNVPISVYSRQRLVE